ncbi:MAG: Fic family protein [Candidatus Nomurabacteria bacterium GW2011_GWF2_35_66]|uniref:Fic family protein n=1 Tax=Candidatus Nomurabacteria bacterium GW2011_GWE1_35_16 TaxID=1618761 RepID=A0A0G0BBP5_9BACT|nr:MAG: Fic family protein [Candidatus Nomurabacteria bacterium GW2011_GWF1_34_20]KKP63562.1 MAG: Fic family protein [Candidatus Nomurabacteria bacterium GW2011_GWE2_34_25]KKP66754.1 MAG: Fic family protein [Candidatus Nomurabacteria bacterium GW2011_GWE1_35_16]KKP83854.1 MAG: Fic family protein [Candidatus Nomurabacteria bacterium GW2011_GWF2_35_66]HAE36357.1 hypothetical protein [Candidatus Nomurabacteria bacterium]
MDSLKKIISLNQASKISGYTQDYLGFLIRKGEIKGMKKGRAWFTTEEEVKNYLFKKKVRHEEFAIKDFFSPTRTRNIIIATIIVFIGGFFILSNLNKSRSVPVSEIQSAVTSDGEGVKVITN